MKKGTKITLWSILFVIVFTVSALIRVNLLGSAPMRLMQVKWDDTVGTIYNDLNYENDYGHKYDLYVPANLDIGNAQQLILFIHGGSFNSGAKEDGEVWCKYYASNGYIAASLDYSSNCSRGRKPCENEHGNKRVCERNQRKVQRTRLYP